VGILAAFSQEKRLPESALRSCWPPRSGRIYLRDSAPMSRFQLGKKTMSYLSRFSCLVAVLVFGNAVRAQDTFTLREQFSPGYQSHVSSRVERAGRLTMPAEKGKEAQSLQVTGQSALEYDERVLTRSSDQNVEKTIRHYSRMDFERKVGDQV